MHLGPARRCAAMCDLLHLHLQVQACALGLHGAVLQCGICRICIYRYRRVRVQTKGFEEKGDYNAAGVEKSGQKNTAHEAYTRVAPWVARNSEAIAGFLLSCARAE